MRVLILLLTAAGGLLQGQPFAVVAHPANPAGNIRFNDLRGMYLGSIRTWPHRAKVVLTVRDPGSAPYRFLVTRILNLGSAEYNRRVSSVEFSGDEPLNIRVLNTDAAACRFAFNVPGAVGVIDAAALRTPACSGVKLLKVDGKLPGQEGYRLQ